MRILGISGSLRKDSHNTALLRAAAELLPPGVELELFDGLRDVPPYDADEDVPELHAPGVLALKDAIARADAVLISTPEYNHSIPGVLKNALDWASRPVADNVLRGKPAAVIGATAHYVTEDLDAGPIIEQGVVRVTHREGADALARIGRDVERTVHARAVGLHLEDRVLVHENRTVVF